MPTHKSTDRVLITGALGQIGSELEPVLVAKFGRENVLASDSKPTLSHAARSFVTLDVCNKRALEEVVETYGITRIFHLAALLSNACRLDPDRAIEVNISGTLNVLSVAQQRQCGVFLPSSIAAFDEDAGVARAGKDHTVVPQKAIQCPITLYGQSKVIGERAADLYHGTYRVDVRGLRYPGLISSGTEPTGGTTDYAVKIFYDALRHGRYECYLRPNTQLDMMLLDDAIRATIELTDAEDAKLRHRTYNLTAVQITPAVLADAIREHFPKFEITYEIDEARQAMADSWPRELDDSAARADWGWAPRFDLAGITTEMLRRVDAKLSTGSRIGNSGATS